MNSDKQHLGRLGVIFLLAASIAACDDPSRGSLPTAPVRQIDPVVVTRPIGAAPTVIDSAAMLRESTFVLSTSALSTSGINIPKDATVEVTVTYAQTARCEKVSVSGAINQVVFPQGVGGCGRFDGAGPEGDGIGLTATLGPATQGGTITFSITSPGGAQVKGSFPNYTVYLHDTMGGDIDDVVLSVKVVGGCDFFKNPTGDPLLQDPSVQQAFRDYWTNSNPGPNGSEQGGWIVEQNGQITVVPFGSNANPQVCTATVSGSEMNQIVQNGGTIQGFFHTHPHPPGSRVPAGATCAGAGVPGARFGDGASQADQTAAGASPWPSYVVDRDHVHALPPNYQKGNPIPKFNRDKTCT